MKGKVIAVVRVLLGLTISVALGWLAAKGLDWSSVGETMAEVSPLLILLSLAVFMLASCIRALRWKVLFVDEPVSVARLFVVQNEGLGLNNLLPVRIGGEAAQLAVLTLRDGLRPATTLATLGMERVLDAVVSTAILGIAFFLVPEMNSFAPYVWGAFGISLVALGAVKVHLMGERGSPTRPKVQFPRRVRGGRARPGERACQVGDVPTPQHHLLASDRPDCVGRRAVGRPVDYPDDCHAWSSWERSSSPPPFPRPRPP